MAAFAFSYSDTDLRVISLGSRTPNRARVVLPPGLVRSGRISDPTIFRQIITHALASAKPNRIKGSDVVIGLPEEHAFIKVLEMPAKLKPSELQSVFEFQWDRLLPVPRDQVYFSYKALKTPKTDKKATTQRVLIVAYPQDIITSLMAIATQLKLSPHAVLPTSFGLAQLFAQSTSEAVLVVRSETGNDSPVLVGESGVPQFSTTIHTPVTSPASSRQLNSIRMYYEKNMPAASAKIKRIVILASPVAQIMAQQFASLAIPLAIGQSSQFFKTKNQASYELESFLDLYGLLKIKNPISILPQDTLEELLARRQRALFRSVVTYMTTTMALMIYFSMVFFTSLAVHSKSKALYSETFAKKVAETTSRLDQESQLIAPQLTTLSSLNTHPSDTATIAQLIGQTVQKAHGITLETLTINNTTKVIALAGQRASEDDLTRFTADLTSAVHSSVYLSQAKVDLVAGSASSGGSTQFSIQITGGTL